MRVLDLDSGLARALTSLGCGVVTGPPTVEGLAGVDLVAMPPHWGLLRDWRNAGARVPVLVVVPSQPDDLTALQPLAVVRSGDPEVLRRALRALDLGRAAGRLSLGAVRVDLEARQVFRGTHSTKLTQREADLLAYLAAREREVEREELLIQVWGHVRPTSLRAVDMAILRLRKKIEPEPTQPRFLLSSYGGGYRLVLPGPDDRVLETLRTSAALLLQHGRPREALELLDQHEAARSPDDVQGAVRRAQLACNAWFSLGDLPRAVELGEQGLQLAQRHGLEGLEAAIGCSLAAVLRPAGSGQRARQLAQRSLELHTHLRQPVGRARALSVLADLAPGTEALELVQQALVALEQAEAPERTGLQAQSLQGALQLRVARGLQSVGRSREAIPHLEQAVRIHEVLGKVRIEGQARIAVASIWLELGELDAVEAPLLQGIEVLRRGDSPRALAHGLVFQVMWLLVAHRIPEALQVLEEVRTLLGEQGTARTALADALQAACLAAAGELDAARAWTAGIVVSDGAHEPIAFYRAALQARLATTPAAHAEARTRMLAQDAPDHPVVHAFLRLAATTGASGELSP